MNYGVNMPNFEIQGWLRFWCWTLWLLYPLRLWQQAKLPMWLGSISNLSFTGICRSQKMRSLSLYVTRFSKPIISLYFNWSGVNPKHLWVKSVALVKNWSNPSCQIRWLQPQNLVESAFFLPISLVLTAVIHGFEGDLIGRGICSPVGVSKLSGSLGSASGLQHSCPALR